ILNEFAEIGDDVDAMSARAKGASIADRETDYQKRKFARALEPTRADAFKEGGEVEGKSYRDIMKEKELEKEEERVRRKIQEKLNSEGADGSAMDHKPTLADGDAKQEDGMQAPKTRKRR